MFVRKSVNVKQVNLAVLTLVFANSSVVLLHFFLASSSAWNLEGKLFTPRS